MMMTKMTISETGEGSLFFGHVLTPEKGKGMDTSKLVLVDLATQLSHLYQASLPEGFLQTVEWYCTRRIDFELLVSEGGEVTIVGCSRTEPAAEEQTLSHSKEVR
jgi:hypothetical protein